MKIKLSYLFMLLMIQTLLLNAYNTKIKADELKVGHNLLIKDNNNIYIDPIISIENYTSIGVYSPVTQNNYRLVINNYIFIIRLIFIHTFSTFTGDFWREYILSNTIAILFEMIQVIIR